MNAKGESEDWFLNKETDAHCAGASVFLRTDVKASAD